MELLETAETVVLMAAVAAAVITMMALALEGQAVRMVEMVQTGTPHRRLRTTEPRFLTL